MSSNGKDAVLRIVAQNVTAEALKKITADLKALDAQSEALTTKGKSSWSSWFTTIAGGAAVGNLFASAFKSALGVVSQLPGQLLELGKRGADVADISSAFKTLTANAGESADVMLGKLRSAFGGTVSDFELMKSANEALARGAKLTATELETMAKGARTLADVIGGDAKQKFDSMLSAIAKGNERELKQLGVNLGNVEQSIAKTAAGWDKEVSALSKSEKMHALKNAVLAESTRILQEHGETTNDYADNLNAIGIQVENFTDSLGVAIATSPVLTEALSFISEAMGDAFGADKTGLVRNITSYVNKAGILLVDVGQIALEVGGIFYRVFSGVKSIVLGVSTVIGGVFTALGAGVTMSLKLASFLPGVGDSLKGAAAAAAEWTNKTAQSTKEIALMTAESAKAAIAGDDMTKMLGRGVDVLGDLRTRLVAASNAKVSDEAITRKLTKSTDDLADATGKQTKAAKEQEEINKKIRAAMIPLNDTQREQVITLSELGLSYGDIAKKLNVSAEAVKKYGDSWKEVNKILSEGLKIAPLTAIPGIEVTLPDIQKNYDAITALARDRSELMRQILGESLADQLADIHQNYEQRRLALDKNGVNYQQALDEINAMEKAAASWATAVWNRHVEDMKKLVPSIGTLFSSMLVEATAAFSSGGLKGLGRFAIDSAKTFATDFAAEVGRIMGPKVQAALSAGSNIASGIGGAVGGGTGAQIAGIASSLGGAALAASSWGTAMAGAGIAGSIALGAATMGIGLAAIGIYKLITHTTEYEKRVRANAQAIKELTATSLGWAGSMEILEARAHLVGIQVAEAFKSNDAAFLKKTLEEVDQKFATLKQTVNASLGGILTEAQGIGFQLPATIEPYLDRMRELGLITDENQQLLSSVAKKLLTQFGCCTGSSSAR